MSSRLNELAGEELVLAHHGSIAREQRLQIEEELKAGRLPGLVATSSLELGIDMGAIDLVVQIEAPPSVAAGLQRIGRAGHQVGEPSVGKIFPNHRSDLLEAAVVVRRMLDGAIEETRIPRNPLDVLAQQIVAICAMDRGRSTTLHALVRRADPFATSRAAVRGRARHALRALPVRRVRGSEAAAGLGPGRRHDPSRDDARVVAVASGGTIPDRGLLRRVPGRRARAAAVAWASSTRRWCTRAASGEMFLLGASTWRIERSRPNR